MKFKFKSGDICYSCGKSFEEVSLTKEHIPPHNLSPQSTDSSFVIVPGCNTCNNLLSHEESKFRDYLVRVSIGRGKISAEKAYEKMKRNFSRNPIGRAGRLHTDELRLIRNMKKRDVLSPQGIYLGTNNDLDMPDDLDHSAIIKKITRGLFFYHTKKVANTDYEIEGALISQYQPTQDFYESFQSMYNRESGVGKTLGDFFAYSGVVVIDGDVTATMWLMKFYDYVKAWGMIINKD